MGTILVVDDEIELRELLTIFLTMKGFDVLEANSGKNALELLAANQNISLIISDVHMQNGDGMFLLKTLKNELKSTIPVMMYSGGSSTELSVYTAEGADAVFEKPINLANLLIFIRNFLGSKIA